MKKLILLSIILISVVYINAQPEQIKKDKYAFSISTLNYPDNNLIGTNPFFFKSNEMFKWNIGGDLYSFTENGLAIVCGVAYGKINGADILSFKFGLKYYIFNHIPIGFDFTESMGRKYYGDYLPIYSGVQIGYAFFIGNHVSIEPTFRYNFSLDKYHFNNFYQIYISFNLFII